ncbi:MAG: transcription-repair coupling factor [Anaerolineae bacterium]
MQLNGLLESLRETAPYRTALRALRAQSMGDVIPALGVIRSARPYVLSALAADWGAPVLYLTARVDRAYNTAEQLPVWLPGRNVLRFSEPGPLFYERSAWLDTAARSRIETLAALLPPEELPISAPPHRDGEGVGRGDAEVIVTSARALMTRTLPVNTFRKGTITLKPGQRWTLDKLITRWAQIGYDSAHIVIEPGTYTRRGGLLDIFPPALPAPIRIEFFDDEIESLRTFDPVTQRTTGKILSAVITPACETLPEGAPQLAAHLAPWFAALSDAGADMTSPRADEESLASGGVFPFLDYYLPYLYPHPVSLLDYAPDNALIVVDDLDELRDTVNGVVEAAEKARTERLNAGLLPPDFPKPYLEWGALEEALRGRTVVALSAGVDVGPDVERHPLDDTFRPILSPENRYGGQIKPMLTQWRELRNGGDRVIAATAQAARLSEIWQEQESAYLTHTHTIDEPPPPRTVAFVDGTLHEGWRLRPGDGDIHLFTDAEIFGWSRPEPRRRKTTKKSRTPETAYANLKEGDFVVHSEYGIGRFAGLRRRTLEGVEREFLLIEYGGNDALFVPIHQADRLTRYVGPDDRPPSLNRLGQADWIRIKTKAQKAAEDEARELLGIYATREAVERPPYPPDTPWQHELEASFPYVETEDQLKAVRDVKADMEQPQPMDRLVSGDVGYGKTEVALRAAFKAVMDGKQVAVLVPTTILAQQHFDTFTRRLIPFPIKVELLSRFRTTDQQRAALAELAAGDVDIMIGTHRLLSNDVNFRNLGLLIIDEEQRFGVKHKEHFKKFRSQVDVLTLTATPIPRTLYMSLSGVRDISMIQTPPEERLPVITHVGPFDERLIRQAILREMERGGQVFVVHNRVQTIEAVRERLEEIVPEARIVVGHGQMDERLLQTVMEQFGNGEFDVLLATAIIESGLDIPNANTLIIDRADFFGLAQLYQLRGRVGRSAQQAYAYFFHPAHNRLSDEAHMRLETLAEYTELGSGYQIAMRDLELRGAGDILSTRQSGQVAAIGLHLYTQMLAQAVRDLKRQQGVQVESLPPEPPISQSSVLIDLPLPAYLPADWIPEMSLRLQIYRRIGGLNTVADVQAMRDELVDRFGALPAAVDGLLYQIMVKLLAQTAGASAVMARRDRIEIRLPYLVELNRERLEQRLGDGARVTRVAVELPLGDVWRDRLAVVLMFLGEKLRAQAVGAV